MIPICVDGTEIFRTVVGSTLWKNDTPESDVDEFICYLMPYRDVLLGKTGKSIQTTKLVDVDGKEHDQSLHEAGTVAHQLLKGNPNFLIGIYSDLVRFERGAWLKMLREAMEGNIAKNCYNAFRGYGVGHYLKYIESGKDASPRRCNIGVRFFNFGTSLLLTGKPDFSPVSESTPEMVFNKFDALKRAYEVSPLPEQPEHPEKIEEWLIDLRTLGV